MSMRLDNLFKVCGDITQIRDQLIELGMIERARELDKFSQELYNDCLDVENAEAGMRVV